MPLVGSWIAMAELVAERAANAAARAWWCGELD